jgi:integrase
MLRQRIQGRLEGKIIGRPDRVLLHDLFEGVKQHYKRSGNRSLDRAEDGLQNLEEFFGEGCKAIAVTKTRVNEYVTKRLETDKRAPATVAYELRMLNLAFSLAVKNDVLAIASKFQVPRVDNVRGQFFSDEEFGLIMLELEPALRPICQYLFLVPWRRDEARNLSWRNVDWQNKEVRLTAAETKEKKGRVFPFADTPIEKLLEERWKVRTSDDGLVFHDGVGRPLGKSLIRYHWGKARTKIGLADRVLHSLRSTSIRNYRIAGVDTATIKSLSGHSTDSVFARYNLIDSKDRARAMAKRFVKEESKQESGSKEK